MRFRLVQGLMIACLFLVCSSACGEVARSDSSWADTVLLQRGRVVDLRFTADIRPRGLNVGDDVCLEIAGDIEVDGVPLLREGMRAVGHIDGVRSRQPVGVPARLRVIVDHAVAVDGTNVPLEGVYTTEGTDRHIESAGVSLFYCVCGLLIPGEDVIVREGTIVTCFVQSDTPVRIKEGQGESQGEADHCSGG